MSYSVNQGLRFYQQGDYGAAIVAFENAERLTPNDLRITYNQACTYLAAGRTGEAMEKFRRAAFAPDRSLVYDSLLSLGNIAVDRADSYLGERPEKTTPGNRRRFLAELLVAEKEFADAIDIVPNRSEAKENLEAIRLWKNALDSLWKENDLKNRLESLTAAEYLDRLAQSQQAIYRKTAAETKRGDSPKKFQSLYLTAGEQADLIPEIEFFWEKFQAEYSSPDRPGVPSDNREGMDQFSLDKTDFRREEIVRYLFHSANELKTCDGKSALQFQSATLEMLDAIQNDLRDYPQLVQLAAERQGRLVNEADKPDSDAHELLWKQRLVYRGVQLFLRDAHRSSPGSSGNDLFYGIEDSPEELLRQSQQAAIATEAELERLFKAIFADLEENHLDAAKPNLRQVRELLRKILEPLEKIPQSSRFSRNTNSRNSTPESDFFDDSPGDDFEESDFEGEKKPSDSTDAPSKSEIGQSSGEPKSLEELIDSFVDNLSEEEQKPASASTQTGTQGSQGKTEPAGGSAKSDSQVDSKQSFPRRPQIADDDPDNRMNLTQEEEELLKVQEQANVLIRAVKRRQQEAEKFRNQIRQLFESAKEREPKDW